MSSLLPPGTCLHFCRALLVDFRQMLPTHAFAHSANLLLCKKSPYDYSVRLEPTKLISVRTWTTYQANGDAGIRSSSTRRTPTIQNNNKNTITNGEKETLPAKSLEQAAGKTKTFPPDPRPKALNHAPLISLQNWSISHLMRCIKNKKQEEKKTHPPTQALRLYRRSPSPMLIS